MVLRCVIALPGHCQINSDSILFALESFTFAGRLGNPKLRGHRCRGALRDFLALTLDSNQPCSSWSTPRSDPRRSHFMPIAAANSPRVKLTGGRRYRDEVRAGRAGTGSQWIVAETFVVLCRYDPFSMFLRTQAAVAKRKAHEIRARRVASPHVRVRWSDSAGFLDVALSPRRQAQSSSSVVGEKLHGNRTGPQHGLVVAAQVESVPQFALYRLS